jgi:hypothetical protein
MKTILIMIMMLMIANGYSYNNIRNVNSLKSLSPSSLSIRKQSSSSSSSLYMSSVTVDKKSQSLSNEGTSSMTISSLNLMKNCVGAGVFSLNSRVTSISPKPEILLPAAGLILLMAMWATYNFYMILLVIKYLESSI